MATLRRSTLTFPRSWNKAQAPTFPVSFDPGYTPSFAFMPCLGTLAPTLTRDAMVVASNALSITATQIGPGATGQNGTFGSPSPLAGNTWAMPQAAGTILFLATVNWASNDNIGHYVCVFGSSSYPGGPTLDFLKHTDNNIYAGWYSGSDVRSVAAAGSLWTAGATVALGLTWGAFGSKLYFNGAQIASNAGISVGNTAAGYINVGHRSNGGQWNSTTQDSISYFQVFDRSLSAADMARFAVEPFGMLQPVVRRPLYAPPSTGTTLTGSAYGRIASRTLIGWTASIPASASARMAARGAIGKAATATPSITGRASTRLAVGFTGTAQPSVNVRLATRLAAGYSATLAASADTRIAYRISSGYSAVLPGNITGSAWPRIATRASSGFLASLTASSTVREAFSAHSGYTATINIGSLPRASTRAVAGVSASLFVSGVVRTSIHLGLNDSYTKIVVTYGVSAYARTRGVSAAGVTRGASAGQRTRGVTAWQR